MVFKTVNHQRCIGSGEGISKGTRKKWKQNVGTTISGGKVTIEIQDSWNLVEPL